MASANIKHVSDSNFEGEVLKSSTPVLIDFWAPVWTVQKFAPVLDELADEYVGNSRS